MKKEICNKCWNEKRMYYKPICFHCVKPWLTKKPILNFIECLYYIEAQEGIDRINFDYYWGNDSIVQWLNECWLSDEDFELFKKHFWNYKLLDIWFELSR